MEIRSEYDSLVIVVLQQILIAKPSVSHINVKSGQIRSRPCSVIHKRKDGCNNKIQNSNNHAVLGQDPAAGKC